MESPKNGGSFIWLRGVSENGRLCNKVKIEHCLVYILMRYEGIPKGGNMNDRAYAKVQTQQKTLTGSSPGSRLLQRTCACGQHTIAGGECSACRNQRSTLHRSQRAFEPPSASAAAQGNSPVRENVSSSNTAINTVPRFGHDFSQIPVYSSHPPLLQTKLTVNQPGDVYEQEADQVAEQVMRMADPNSPLSDDEDEREAEISSTRMIKGYQTEQMPIDRQVGVARVQRKNKRRPEERFFPHQVFLGSGLSGRHNEKNKLRLWFHLQPESWQADAKNGSSPILVSTYYRIIDKSKPTFLVDVAPLTPQEQDVEKLLRETLGKEIKITTIRNFVDKNFEQLETADVNLSGS